MKAEITNLLLNAINDRLANYYMRIESTDEIKYLSAGVSRTVVKIPSEPGKVFKITRYDDNSREVMLWAKLKPEDKQFFAAPLDFANVTDKNGDNWELLEMEEIPGKLAYQSEQAIALSSSDDPDANLEDLFPDIYMKLRNTYHLRDLHGANYKIVDSKPVIFDYANYD